MTEAELTLAIHDYIRSWYKATFVGLLEVHKTDTNYIFILGVPHYMFPTTIISSHDTDQEFLDFIYSELRTRNYMRQFYYKVIRTPEIREE